MARRKYTREFKISAVKLVNEQGYSSVQAAKSLGVDPASVREWVKKFSAEDGLAPSGEGAIQGYTWIVQTGNVTHRMFVPGEGMDGVPIRP
jgi:transposase-like protein